ncbi:MAG TPA: hypothetical protein VKR59_22475 [Terriglobales bacterium]|nr:hypothetical protein [Terriglobales bacterium]
MTHIRQFASPLLIVVLAIGAASAQSLGDYARTVRKNKTEPTSTTRTFDNDNLPTGGTLSVVGPAPAADVSPAKAARATLANPNVAAAQRQKVVDDWTKKLAKAQANVDSLNHELDIDQREYRLRAAVAASDPASRLRNPEAWTKEEEQSKSSIDEKQKALDAARQELSQMQEEAHKAGIEQQDKDKGNQ